MLVHLQLGCSLGILQAAQLLGLALHRHNACSWVSCSITTGVPPEYGL